MSQKGQVRSYTRKTKSGKTITVKAHTRKTKGSGASTAKGAGSAYTKRRGKKSLGGEKKYSPKSKFPPLEVRDSPKSKFTRKRKAVTKKDKEMAKNIRQRGYTSPRDNY